MNYINAKEVLPPELLKEIQKYLSGEILYIPKKEEKRVAWGQFSGAKALIKERNKDIIDKYKLGSSVDELIIEFCLSESSIKKIIYTREHTIEASALYK